MADMLKFFKGLEASLPAVGANGAIYITTDEGGIYLGTGTGMKRLGDFVQVANVAALPAKAHENCLYYCVAENILAKWNGTEWKQINKQPTADELKTLLGLGAMAYKSEVAEADLNADLKAKVNASAAANHSHANKDLLDTYTQTEANLADAVAKKHAHTFNETELNKIVEGDVAKWNGVAADHLTSEDKTTLENAIKDAKKAGTDANTALEAYKVTNDARVLAVEEDVAEIMDGTNGILAQAKAYSDGKLATARTEITAEIDADVKVVNDALEAYKTSNDSALAGVKATAEAAATKAYTDEELAKKVDKATGKSLVDDTEIARLAAMSDGANKVEKSDINGNIKIDGVETVVYTHPAKHNITDIEGLQDALDGKQSSGDFAAENHKHVKADITDFDHTHIASEITDLDATIKGYDYATKAEAQGYADAKDDAIEAAQKAADDLAAYVGEFVASEGVDTVVKYIDAKTANVASDATVSALADRVEQAEKDIDAIEADYLKAADKTELAGLISAEETRAKGVEEGLQNQINLIMNNPDTKDVIDSIAEFTQYVADHGTIADGMRTDINKNKEDIAAINNADTGILKQANDYADSLAGNYAAAEHDHVAADITDFESAVATKVESYGYATTGYADQAEADAKAYADAEVAKDRARLDDLEAIDHDAYVDADATLKAELQAEIDADVKALADNTYTKDQTYTQDEVDAAITAAVEAATAWGEF